MNGDLPVDTAAEITLFAMLGAAIIFTAWRLIRGPSLPDRIVALDLMALLSIGFIVLYAIATDSSALVDLGLVVALVAFLSTVAFAYFLEKSTLPEDQREEA